MLFTVVKIVIFCGSTTVFSGHLIAFWEEAYHVKNQRTQKYE